jgi:hypothetical protein
MRKRTKRKHYGLLTDPIRYVLEGVQVTPESELDKLRMQELSAIESFRIGQASLADWNAVKAMMNVAETMARRGIGEEVLSVCMQAQDHLIEAARRFERIGKMGGSGPALQVWRDLYEYHDLQRKSVTRSEYERFIQEAINRERSHAPEVFDLSRKEKRL